MKIKKNYCTIFILFTGLFNAYTQSNAEWQPAQKVLVHTPGTEIIFGVLHPKAALYEQTFSVSAAQKEHEAFIKTLENNNIEVVQVKNLLVNAVVDDAGKIRNKETYEALKAMAKNAIRYDSKRLPVNLKNEQLKYFEETLNALTPKELIEAIIYRPEIILYPANNDKGYSAKYQISPLMNLYFTRDQSIVTSKGLVIGKLKENQRQPEAALVEIALINAGIEVVYKIEGKESCLEGGDFMMAGKAAIIARGMRTNQKAINELIENDVFGTDEVVVVKENWKNQQQMHLDTYFNIISPKLAVIDERRLGIGPDDPFFLACDRYVRKKNGEYQLIKENGSFIN